MTFDLSDMTVAELNKLARAVEKEIAAKEKRARKDALAEMKAVASKHGLALEDLIGGDEPAKPARKPRKAKKAKKAKAPAKYANPADKSQTWSGRGRRPDWVNAGLAAGKSLDDFAI